MMAQRIHFTSASKKQSPVNDTGFVQWRANITLKSGGYVETDGSGCPMAVGTWSPQFHGPAMIAARLPISIRPVTSRSLRRSPFAYSRVS